MTGGISYNKNDNIAMIIGEVTKKGVEVKTFDNGKSVATFTIGYNRRKNDDGTFTGKYLKVQAWGRLGKEYCANLEPKDVVVVIGSYTKDKYWSEKKCEDVYILNAEFVIAQQYYGEAEDQGSFEDNPFADDQTVDDDLPI